MDVSGEHHLDVLHSVFKTRLSEDGKPIEDDTERYNLGATKEGEGEEGKEEGGVAKKEEQVLPKDDKKEEECGRCCCVCTMQIM